MAQTESGTTQGYAEIAKLVAGEAATKAAKVCCLKTACTADATQTYAGVTKCTESGVSMVAATTVVTSQTTVANDTVEMDHVFTAGEPVTVLGFGLFNNEATPDVLFMLCCFAAAIPLENTDTLTIEGKMQIKLGAT